MTYADLRNWFGTEGGGGLILPDGWYGRPYDNRHQLTTVSEDASALTLGLNDVLKLEFTGLKGMTVQGHSLIIGPFDRLAFHWKGYGNRGTSGKKEYLNGEVRVVSRPDDSC